MADQEETVVDQTEQQNGGDYTEGTEPMEGQETGGGDALQEQTEDAEKDNSDEDERKLFVGNLSWETTQQDLKDYFKKFGEVETCTLKTEMDTRRSRGFGFVVFASADVVEKVLEIKDHKLNGRNIDPKRANPRREICKKIFVGKCDPSTTEDELKEYFGTFGKIEKVELPFDKQKESRRGFVFIEFDTEAAVKKVLSVTTHKLGNQEFDVKKATPTGQAKRGRGMGYDARGGRGGYGYGGYNQGYGAYGGYGGYDQNYYGNYGGYGGYGGWNYDQGYYGGYGGSGYGGYDYGNGNWAYDQGQQNSSYGKTQKSGRGGGYHPYNR